MPTLDEMSKTKRPEIDLDYMSRNPAGDINLMQMPRADFEPNVPEMVWPEGKPKVEGIKQTWPQATAGAAYAGFLRLSKGMAELPAHLAYMAEALDERVRKTGAGYGQFGGGLTKLTDEQRGKISIRNPDSPIHKILKDPAEWFGRGIDDLIANHPEWQGEPPSSFADLLRSPKKLSTAVFQSIPVLVGSGVLMATGHPIPAVTLMYAAEGQEAYDEALANGQSEEVAEKARALYGSVAATIEFAQVSHGLKLIKGIRKPLINRTAQKLVGKKLSKQLILTVAQESVEEMAQGTWQEATAKTLYGKPIFGKGGIKGFADRRAQEALVAATLTGIAGGGAGISAVASRIEVARKDIVTAEQRKIEVMRRQRENLLPKVRTEAEVTEFEKEVAGIAEKPPTGEAIAPAEPTVAKESWEMTRDEYIEQTSEKATEGIRQKATDREYRVLKAHAEKLASKDHKDLVKLAVKSWESWTPKPTEMPVPREVLQEYKTEKWAQEALAKPEVAEKPAEVPTDILGGLTAIQKLTNLVKIAKPIPGKTEILRHKERQRRVAIYEKSLSEQLKKGLKPEEALVRARRAFAGPYKGAAFQPPAELGFMETDRQELFKQIAESGLPAFRKNNANDALLKVLAGTDNITNSEINLLEEMFGPELAKVLVSKRPLGQRARAFALDAIGVPKAFIASFDLSAPLRQGFWLLPGHPINWSKSFASMIKTAIPGGKGIIYATELQARIKNDPLLPTAERSGLYIAPLFETGSKLTQREEQFMTRLAQKIPGIKWSERTYVTFLNQFRFNVFQSTIKRWQRHGRTFEKYPQDYKAYAKWINYMTGRGSLGKKLGWLGPELNAIFFSPRYRVSRIQIPYSAAKAAVKGQGYVLKEQARDLVSAVGTGLALLTLASLAGHDVEDDPRSSDWGKIKIKGTNTRIDIWAGMQQPARTVIRSMMKERKSTTTGKIKPITPLEEIGAYARSGMSPIGGLTWDILATKTYMGEEMELAPATFKRELRHRGIPIAIQDIIDIIDYEHNYESLLPITAPAGFLGVGVQTYKQTQKSPFKKPDQKTLKFRKKAG